MQGWSVIRMTPPDLDCQKHEHTIDKKHLVHARMVSDQDKFSRL